MKLSDCIPVVTSFYFILVCTETECQFMLCKYLSHSFSGLIYKLEWIYLLYYSQFLCTVLYCGHTPLVIFQMNLGEKNEKIINGWLSMIRMCSQVSSYPAACTWHIHLTHSGEKAARLSHQIQVTSDRILCTLPAIWVPLWSMVVL